MKKHKGENRHYHYYPPETTEEDCRFWFFGWWQREPEVCEAITSQMVFDGKQYDTWWKVGPIPADFSHE